MIEGGITLATAVYTGVGGLSFGLSFLFVRWLADFIAGRVDRKEARVDAGMRELLDDLRQEIDRLKEECVAMRAALAECERKHAESEARVLGLEAEMQGYGNVRNEVQRRVAAERLADKDREGKE